MAMNLACYPILYDSLDKFTAPEFKRLVPEVEGALTALFVCATCYPFQLAKTRMQAYQETQVGKKPPGVLKTLREATSQAKSACNSRNY
ncbi:hypothetical protein CRG98_049893, partial [Punica granatum]